MAAVQEYLTTLKTAYNSHDSLTLRNAFHQLQSPFYHRLQADLRSNQFLNQDLSQLALRHIPLQSSPYDSERFQTLVADLLAFVQQYPHPSAALSSNHDTDWAKAYDAWALVYSRASTFFSLPDTTWFIPTLRLLATTLVSFAMTVDSRLADQKKPKTTDAASRLSKAAGMAGNDRSSAPGTETKRAAVLMLANLSFKAYFNLNNTRLCETVVGSVENAFKLNRNFAPAAVHNGSVNTHDDPGELCYTRADRVTYKYYLGRLRFFQHGIKAAAAYLRWSFDNCTNRHLANKRAILIPLISSYLILGRYPDQALLSLSSLTPYFSALVHHLKQGNGQGVLDELDRNMDWFRTHGIYLILKEKLQLSIWRNLARRTLVMSRASAPPSAAPPTLRLSVLHVAARLAWQDDELQVQDVESILASLIDQGLVKGYILHSKSMLVLQKGPHLGFPPVWSVWESR